VSYTIAPPANQDTRYVVSPLASRALSFALFVLCVMLLFANLGGPALFEPDEGRNAEKAREILVLGDWLTPHENFLPVLDKPMAFYWVIAGAYKLFGVSEWSARLPSALAALGCLFLLYRFARIYDGVWVARWGMLILLTSLEFFLLARVVILDMVLTFFVTLTLMSFYSAVQAGDQRTRRWSCWLMYVALALGTLVKGLAGLVVPGMIMFFYLFLTRKWRLLRELHLSTGAVIYLVLTVPWYAWAGAENPGYLRYYLWEEHFNRFWTDEFKRSQGWYYYFLVLAVGFLPWTTVLPLTIRRLWRKMDDKSLFLAVWAAIPFIFFSASHSKLPHYLLPVYPPLAILTAQTVVAVFSSAASAPRSLFSVWAVCAALLLYLALGAIAPDLVTWRIRSGIEQSRLEIALGTLLVLMAYGLFGWWCRESDGVGQTRAFICTGFALSVLFLIILQLQDLISLTRSARTVARAIAPQVHENRLVLYNTYPTGLIFYLGLSRPAWIVPARGKRSPVIDSPYLQYSEVTSSPRFGKILMSNEEFSRLWPNADPTVRVLVKETQLAQFREENGAPTRPLLRAGEYLLVAREHSAAPQPSR
jgi:hypothetical protein